MSGLSIEMKGANKAMIEKICNRCLESKPIDQFSKGAYRCHPCRAEANKLNVQHHRDLTKEIAENRKFSEIMRNWMAANRGLMIR